MAEQLSSFATASDRTEQQKQALLAAVANAGSKGAAAYEQAQTQTGGLKNQAVSAALGAASTSPVAGIPGGSAAITAPIEQNFAMRQADLAQGAAGFQQDIARQQASGEQYFGRMQTALPVVENYTRQAVEKILSAERESQADRQLQREIAQNQLAQSRQSASGNSLRDQIAQNEENRRALCFENPNDPRCQDPADRRAEAAEKKAAGEEAFQQTYQEVLTSEPGKVGQTISAILFDEKGKRSADPWGNLQKLLAAGTLETAADADRGGVGKSHRQGALNYEYIRDRLVRILNAGQPSPELSAEGEAGIRSDSGNIFSS